MKPQWQPVNLPEGLVDEGESSATETSLYDDEQSPARVMVNGAEAMSRGAPLVEAAQPGRSFWSLFNKKQQRLLVAITVSFFVILGLTVALVTYSRVHQDLAYVAWPFSAVYQEAAVSLPINTLQRGETVVVLQRNGRFAQVRDMDGKIGFMESTHLSEKAPAYVAGSPFFGCRQYLSENAADACLERAESQFKACNDLCKSDISGQCQAECQAKVVSCRSRCGK